MPIEDDPPLFDPNNPCDVVDSLLKTTAFSVLLHKLRDSTINNYEIGYSQLNTLNPANYSETYYTGQFNSETLSVDVILNYVFLNIQIPYWHLVFRSSQVTFLLC